MGTTTMVRCCQALAGLTLVACMLLVSTADAIHATAELSALDQSNPPSYEDASLGEADTDSDPGSGTSPEDSGYDRDMRETQDEREVQHEAEVHHHGELGEASTDPIDPQQGQQQASTEGTITGDNHIESPEAAAGIEERHEDPAKPPADRDAAQGKFFDNIYVTAAKQTLRVGQAWGMPGIYSSDGAARDLILGTAGGGRIYFGTAKNDAWIEATTGHMWLKGSITVKNYAHFFAEGQRLRVGAAFGMPGLYASDGGNRDMIIGTASGKKIFFGTKNQEAFIEAGAGNLYLKGSLEVNANGVFKVGASTLQVGGSYDMPGIYAGSADAADLSLGTLSGRRIFFGVGKEDAFIQAGTGNMFLKGSLTSQENAFFISENQKLRVGSVHGMPGIYASDGDARDLMLGTEAGRKIYFGKHKQDAWIQAGTGDAMLAGALSLKKSMSVEAFGQKLRVGEYAGMPGLYSSDDGPRDMILGVATGKKVYVGEGTDDTYFTAGTGNLWLKGSLEAHDNMFIYSENQRLRVGSVDGIPGIFSSDGAARDLMLGTAKNSKIYFGEQRSDAWIQAGTGDSFFKGKMLVTDSLTVEKNGQTLLVGESFGMPGLYSSEGVARDLMLGVASGKKVYLGYGTDDSWVEAGTGNSFFKGKVSANDAEVQSTLTVKKDAFFSETVTVSKNLILASSMGMMDMSEEMSSLRDENMELRSLVAEMREQMSEFTELMRNR